MRVIGITGGVGSGKSAILGYLETAYSCEVVYSDELTAKLQKKGERLYEAMVGLFGEDYLLPDGELDRGKIARRVFGNEEELNRLNDTIHPIVVETIVNMINDAKTKGKTDFFFVEAALLIETGFDKICDELWYIYAQKKVRIQRLKESRGYTEKQIVDMFDRQLPEEEFRKHCQVVIDNSGELEESIAQIRGILEGYLRDN